MNVPLPDGYRITLEWNTRDDREVYVVRRHGCHIGWEYTWDAATGLVVAHHRAFPDEGRVTR